MHNNSHSDASRTPDDVVRDLGRASESLSNFSSVPRYNQTVVTQAARLDELQQASLDDAIIARFTSWDRNQATECVSLVCRLDLLGQLREFCFGPAVAPSVSRNTQYGPACSGGGLSNAELTASQRAV